VLKHVSESCDFDVLVIDDGSTDSTASILKGLKVEVLTHPTCSGSMPVLSALEIGRALGYKYVIKIDGDDQHDPRDIPRLYLHAIQTGADMVIGSRHLNQYSGKIFSLHGIGMWFCSKLVSVVSGSRITDATSGFKVWAGQSADITIQAFNNGKLKEDSTFLIEELLILSKKKLRIEELAVVMRDREHGESKSYSKRKLALFPLNLIRSTCRALF